MSMIPDSVISSQTRDWKILLAESFRRVQDLLDYCQIEQKPGQIVFDSHIDYEPQHEFPIRVTRYYADQIEKGNANDPLLLQVLPQRLERVESVGYSLDAVGDHQASPLPGLIHKYHGRALLMLTGACAIHCRYCFRRHYPYNTSSSDCSVNGEVYHYLSKHPELTEIILSGGDPLMLSDHKLAGLVQSLNQLSHIKTLRIHSRLLSVLPERINDSLLSVLDNFNGQVVFVTHINHPHEIDSINQACFKRLHQHGYHLFNQSVLLRQVNDDADTLTRLSKRLFESHIQPYYLHALDKVQGAAHFDIDAQQACTIYQQLQKKLPGYLVPKMVRENAGELSKTPLHCV